MFTTRPKGEGNSFCGLSTPSNLPNFYMPFLSTLNLTLFTRETRLFYILPEPYANSLTSLILLGLSLFASPNFYLTTTFFHWLLLSTIKFYNLFHAKAWFIMTGLMPESCFSMCPFLFWHTNRAPILYDT